jgi:hypothetical protein
MTTYNLTTPVGQVRLKIGDTILASAVFTDAEITYFLTAESNSINLAAADALEAWASKYGANADSEGIGNYRYSQSIVDKLLAMAKRLRETETAVPAFDIASLDLVTLPGEEGIEDVI